MNATDPPGIRQAPRPRTLAHRAATLLVARRRLVMLAWLVVVLAAAPLAIGVGGTLSGAGWNVQHSESDHVRQELRRDFARLGVEAAVVVIRAPDPAARTAAVGLVVGNLLGRPSVLEVTDPGTQPASAGLVSPDGLTALVPVRLRAADDAGLPKAATDVRDTVESLALPVATSADTTGEWPVWADFNDSNSDALHAAELISGVPTLVLLVVVFGSVLAAGLPLMLATSGIAVSFAGLYLVDLVTPLSLWSMNFALMIGLAVGIDCSLFVLTRYRAARTDGEDLTTALAGTLATAGKAVLLSGLALTLAFGSLFLLPVMVFRSLALGMIVAVVAVVLAALTLLPAVLAALGDRVLRGRRPRGAPAGHGRWDRWSARVVERPVPALLVGLALLGALAAPVAGLAAGMPGARVVDSGRPSRDGYQQLIAAFGPGAGAVLYLTTPQGEAARVLESARQHTGVRSAEVVTGPASTGRVVVRVTPTTAVDDPRTAVLVGDLRDELATRAPGTLTGGPGAQSRDLTTALGTTAPGIVALVLLMSLLMVLVVFRSIVLALVSVAMNLLTVGAALGIAALVFQHGVGARLIGIDPQGFVDAWAPVFFFALLFGLSMDYQLFLLAAIRERYERTGNTRQAVREGLAATGKPITNAAVIMVIVFLAFGVTGPIPPTEMGLTLAAAVVLDATVVRMIVVPSIITLVGERTWWIPRSLDRILPELSFRH